MNSNSAILQHMWDTSWNLGPAAKERKIDSFMHSESILQDLALLGEDWPQEEGCLTGRGGL
jgi:hypothetical protein